MGALSLPGCAKLQTPHHINQRDGESGPCSKGTKQRQLPEVHTTPNSDGYFALDLFRSIRIHQTSSNTHLLQWLPRRR